MSVRGILFFLLLLPGMPALALSLSDAYALALHHDPTFLAAVEEYRADQQEKAIGRAALLPSLNYTYTNAQNWSDVTQDTQVGEQTIERDYRSYSSVLNLQQPLFDMAAWAQYRQGVARAALGSERFRSRSQELLLRVFSSYSEALLAGEQVQLARSQREAYAERQTLNQRLLEGGEGTRTDWLETRARYDLALAQEIEAENEVDAALRELESIIGQPVELDSLSPLAHLDSPAPLQPASFEAWRDLLLSGNPELAAQRHALTVAEQTIRRHRAGHLPKLSLYASTRKTKSDSETSFNQTYDTDSIGIQLTVPLFAGGGVSGLSRQASYRLEQASHELDAQTSSLLNELRRQYNLYQTSATRTRAYEMAVQSADTLVEATRQSVLGGERVNLDVLDAQHQLYSARRDLVEARHQARLARLQLRYLAGVVEVGDLE